ncbi:MAG: PAS domain S-box protein [Desulfurivibrionaceae bacterium]
MKKNEYEELENQLSASKDEFLLRKKEIKALRKSEKRYRDIFENANDLIHSLNTEGRILYVNRLWRETLGYSEEEATNMKIFDIVDASCRTKCESIFTCLMKGQKCEPTETIFTAKDGRKFVMEGRCTPKLEDGMPVELLGIFRDITERKFLEKEKEKLICELTEALSKVKALEGILPICASCKMIRDENGGWNQIEAYIRDRSEAQFSHGICPDCAKKLYPDFYNKIDRE